MEKVLFCWSGGKDSAMALYEIQKSQKYEIVSLLTIITEDYERVSMHGVPRVLIEQQAYSLALPVYKVLLPSSCSNEDYELKMRQSLTKFEQDGVSSVVFGDVFLEWGRNTAELARSFIDSGFQAITTCVDSKVLDKGFIGRPFDKHFLAELPPTIDPGGENGEFHSFVFDGPIFKERVTFMLGEVVLRDSFHFCDLLPKVSVID